MPSAEFDLQLFTEMVQMISNKCDVGRIFLEQIGVLLLLMCCGFVDDFNRMSIKSYTLAGILWIYEFLLIFLGCRVIYLRMWYRL